MPLGLLFLESVCEDLLIYGKLCFIYIIYTIQTTYSTLYTELICFFSFSAQSLSLGIATFVAIFAKKFLGSVWLYTIIPVLWLCSNTTMTEKNVKALLFLPSGFLSSFTLYTIMYTLLLCKTRNFFSKYSVLYVITLKAENKRNSCRPLDSMFSNSAKFLSHFGLSSEVLRWSRSRSRGMVWSKVNSSLDVRNSGEYLLPRRFFMLKLSSFFTSSQSVQCSSSSKYAKISKASLSSNAGFSGIPSALADSLTLLLSLPPAGSSLSSL